MLDIFTELNEQERQEFWAAKEVEAGTVRGNRSHLLLCKICVTLVTLSFCFDRNEYRGEET